MGPICFFQAGDTLCAIADLLTDLLTMNFRWGMMLYDSFGCCPFIFYDVFYVLLSCHVTDACH